MNPVYRRHGIGTALLADLAEEAANRDYCAHQVGLSYAASDSVDFFVRHGFRHLMRTRFFTLDPTRIPDSTRHWITEAEHLAQRLAIRFRSLATVKSHAGLSLVIAELHTTIYQQTHAWSPLALLDPETAITLFLGDDLISDALFVAFDGNRPIGVSSLRRSDSATAFDLGWTGVLTEFRPRIPDPTLALFGHTFSFAQATKRSISIEFDAADNVSWNLIVTYPVSYQSDWLNRERPGN